MDVPIFTLDQRVRVFVSSTWVNWHRSGRRSAGRVERLLRLPLMFELGAAPAEALTDAQDGGGAACAGAPAWLAALPAPTLNELVREAPGVDRQIRRALHRRLLQS